MRRMTYVEKQMLKDKETSGGPRGSGRTLAMVKELPADSNYIVIIKEEKERMYICGMIALYRPELINSINKIIPITSIWEQGHFPSLRGRLRKTVFVDHWVYDGRSSDREFRMAAELTAALSLLH